MNETFGNKGREMNVRIYGKGRESRDWNRKGVWRRYMFCEQDVSHNNSDQT